MGLRISVMPPWRKMVSWIVIWALPTICWLLTTKKFSGIWIKSSARNGVRKYLPASSDWTSLWTNCMIITGSSRLWAESVNIPSISKKGTRVVFYRWNILWPRKAISAMLRYSTKYPVHSESQWCKFFNRYGMYPLSYAPEKALSASYSGWITWKNPLKQM